MKARIKATGEIIEISEDCSYLYAEYYDKSYNLNELEFLDVKEKSFPKDTSDYWTRLEHQAAIAAMQGILSNHNLYSSVIQMTQVSRVAIDYAQELVEKMKENEKAMH